MTLKQLRDRVTLNLGTGFMDANGIVPASVDQVINEYYTQLAFNTRTIENNYTLTTDGSQKYALDHEFMLIKRVLYDYVSDTQYGMEVEEVTPYQSMEDQDVSTQEEYSAGVMQYWLEHPHSRSYGYIWFDPKPPTGKIIRVMAIKYPEFMVDDSEVAELKQCFDLLLIQGPTMELGNIGPGIPNRFYFERKYEVNLEKAKRILSRASANKPARIRYRETWE